MNLFTTMLTTMAVPGVDPDAGSDASCHARRLLPRTPGTSGQFTGGVRVEMLFEAVDPSHASGGSVTFEPGARTAWHSHPRGQIYRAQTKGKVGRPERSAVVP